MNNVEEFIELYIKSSEEIQKAEEQILILASQRTESLE